MIALPEVLRIISFSKTSLYTRMRAGTFPRPIRLGERSVRWIEREIHEWVQRCERTR